MREYPRRRRMKRQIKRFEHKMQATLVLVFCMIAILFGFLIWRIYSLNQDKMDDYKKKVLSQQTYMSSVIPYKRGDVKDRNLITMATSVHVYDMLVDPKYLLEESHAKYKEASLNAVGKCFNGEVIAEIEQVLMEKPDSQYVRLDSGLDMDAETVKEFQDMVAKDKSIRGVWLEEKYARKYPLGTVGCHVVGFSNSENLGMWGIEEVYNERLNGVNGREYGYFDAELNLERTLRPAENGYMVISTIDANVQRIVENRMVEWQNEVGSENMGVIVANPNNGEIIAMANIPVYDLNNPRDLTAYYSKADIKNMSEEEQMEALNKIWRNFCISDTYEPGSTYKPFTVSAALEEGVATPESTYNCNGIFKVANWPIRCVSYYSGGHGTLNLSGTLEQSCNPALMQMGLKLGRNEFFRYNSLFGFGIKTGIDLPGEATGIVHTLEDLNPVQIATSSFGQTQNVTMIQMLAGFCSLINGGSYYEPHVVKRIVNEQGVVIEEKDSYLMKQTVSKPTSDFIRQALFQTVETGTAGGAKVEGYEICGKTGTAEKKERDDKNYLLSFLGFTPLENPQIVIYVVIDQPHVEEQARSSIATEFASKVLKEILPFLEVYPNRKVKKEESANGNNAEEGAGNEGAANGQSNEGGNEGNEEN